MKDRTNTYYRSRSSRWSSGFRSVLHGLRQTLGASHPSISPRTFFLVVLSLLTGGLLCLQIIWQQVKVAQIRYQIGQIRENNHQLRMEVQHREMVVSRLERLERIETIARTQLGMSASDRVPVIELEKTRWVKLPRKGERSP